MENLFEIKICGINDKTSMNVAINSGVNYIGLVFYNNSPRNLSVSDAKSLIKNRTSKTKIVALTVNPNENFLLEINR